MQALRVREHSSTFKDLAFVLLYVCAHLQSILSVNKIAHVTKRISLLSRQ